MEKTCCKIICGAPTTFAVKGLMMTMTLIPIALNYKYILLGSLCYDAIKLLIDLFVI